MIYSQFDPDEDLDIFNLIEKNGQLPGWLQSLPKGQWIDYLHAKVSTTDEAYLFSVDEEHAGFLWLSVLDGGVLEVQCMYMDERFQSSSFRNKLMDFAIKRTRYLGLHEVRFNIPIEGIELSQLSDELGCSPMERDGENLRCWVQVNPR